MARRASPATLRGEDAGSCLPSPWRRSCSRSRSAGLRVLTFGPEGAGKTALLGRLTPGGSAKANVPTIGFDVEAAEVDNLTLTCWDMGGQGGADCDSDAGTGKLGPLARRCFESVDVLLFVIDASGHGPALSHASAQLSKALSSGIIPRDRRVVVAANKQDISGALSGVQVSDALRSGDRELSRLQLQVVETSAETGQGLEDLVSALASPARRAASPTGPSAKASAKAAAALRSFRNRGAPCAAKEELASLLAPDSSTKRPRTIFGALRVASVF